MAEQSDQAVVPKIDLRQAKEEFDRGEALFVDLRNALAYERSHIPGALSIPLRELLRRTEELPRDRPIITY